MFFTEEEYYMRRMVRFFRTAGVFLFFTAFVAGFSCLMAIV